eukprot:TRINITY_DN12627_c0_g1_i5.p1 TRINITY_DN12627_c0_g1~~TRINITY_DN12627_c0_g1_i5.p1  ORF type:complete len:478 (-),score=103.81 TRINITY_DN12627_c0_g1_i5:25-1458(-)
MLTRTLLKKQLGLNISQRRGFEMALVLSAVGLIGTYTFFNYRVSKPNEYLIRTGLGISDISVKKKGISWPLQTYKFVNMNPTNFSFELHAMSTEKMEFVLPGVFTIGPKDSPEAIEKFAKLLLASGSEEEVLVNMNALVKGILEGETRLESAQMTIEKIFNDRKAFKEILVKNVQKELDQFGLYIYNANIKELQDSEGSEYFAFLRQKKRSEAENKAKVDVAEAQKTGDIGKKERECATRIQVAQLEAETILSENSRAQEVELSNAELEVVRMAAHQKKEIAKIEAINISKMRDAEMLKEVEFKRISMETERLRAAEMSQAQVNAEKESKSAEGLGSATRITAEAALYSAQRNAEAELFAKQKQAEGTLALYQAQAEGISKLVAAFQGNTQHLIQYLMLNNGLYETLSNASAKAIQGLEPKITIWNTNSSDGDSGYAKAISDVMKTIPPMISTIHDQTGIQPPGWIAQLPQSKPKSE